MILGCATQEYEVEIPTIVQVEDKNFVSLDALKMKEIEISRPENGSFEVTGLKDAPLMGAMCGGAYAVHLDPGTEVLKNADLVLELKGVREVWVPINGAPTRLYLFDIK